MRYSSLAISLLAISTCVFATPVICRRTLSRNDTSTLQLALFLEHIEYALYE
jgi:hypothetical protein